jgi:hypothetical protein
MLKGKFEGMNQQLWESDAGFLQRQKIYLVKARNTLKERVEVLERALMLASNPYKLNSDDDGDCPDGAVQCYDDDSLCGKCWFNHFITEAEKEVKG